MQVPPRRHLLALAVLAGALALAPAAGATGAKSVYVDGDSLAVGTDLYLHRYLRGWTITATTGVSRHAYQGAAAIRALGSSLPRVVVVNLGTNDDPGAVRLFSGYVREVVRTAGTERCVIWASIVRPPYNGVSYSGYNTVLARAAKRWANFHVFDWVSLAHAHRSTWFSSDGVHPAISGYRARAAALAKLIRKRC